MPFFVLLFKQILLAGIQKTIRLLVDAKTVFLSENASIEATFLHLKEWWFETTEKKYNFKSSTFGNKVLENIKKLEGIYRNKTMHDYMLGKAQNIIGIAIEKFI